MNLWQKLKNDNRGSIILFVVIFGTICFTLIIFVIAESAIQENKASRFRQAREEALDVAEAGAAYYRWHLAHDSTDYYDGNPTNTPGPYVHDYKDKIGNVIGRYSLNVIPPVNGSTVVTVKSTGWLDIQPNSKRTVTIKIGYRSLADYAFLTNSEAWIGDLEQVHGKLHSNGGIRFDGLTDAPVTSAMVTYTCKTSQGCSGNQIRPGIWGYGGPSDYWTFPVPAVDFDAITAKLAEIKTAAQAAGIYLSPSGKQGWRLRFKDDGTISIMKVNTCIPYKGKDIGGTHQVTYCVDAGTFGPATNYDIPENGYIFIDDNVWVDGTVRGRVTVGTGPGNSIIINDDLLYSVKDGSDVLGLIAEQNILIPHDSPDILEINAAMVAQNGATKRYYYANSKKTSLTTYGSIITNGIWTWSWVNNSNELVSGYGNTNSIYDVNLTYNPPPGFPVGSNYELISWEEEK